MRLNMDDGDDITVDMGPLIDCVFLLLIFFLVSTTMKKPDLEIPVELPDPGISGMEVASAQAQEVSIDLQGIFYWGSTPIGQKELHEKIKEIGTNQPNQHVRIRVDRNAPASHLVQLLDLCAYEGLKNYALHTQDRNAPKMGSERTQP